MNPKGRFLLLRGDIYYPAGWSDYRGRSDSKEEAEEHGRLEGKGDPLTYFQVIDLETNKVCCSEGLTYLEPELPTVHEETEVCGWCGKPYSEHAEYTDLNLNRAVPRVPCLGLRSGFISRQAIEASKPKSRT